MQHDEASRTMHRPALLRAAHQIIDDDPKIHVDPIAVGLTPESSIEAIREREPLLRSPDHVLLRSTFVLRARYAEDCLTEAVAGGLAQYVILGAGLDTFAYRQPSYASQLRIFEVDHPVTQQWKRKCLERRGITPPPNVSYVGVDFEREPLPDALSLNGLDASQPAFFSCLGVVQYLTPSAVTATIRFVAKLPPRSAITLSYALPDELLTGNDLEVARECAVSCAARGEPWLSRYRPGEMQQLAMDAGFSSTQHLTPEAATERYFRSRCDGLHAPRYVQLLTATV